MDGLPPLSGGDAPKFVQTDRFGSMAAFASAYPSFAEQHEQHEQHHRYTSASPPIIQMQLDERRNYARLISEQQASNQQRYYSHQATNFSANGCQSTPFSSHASPAVPTSLAASIRGSQFDLSRPDAMEAMPFEPSSVDSARRGWQLGQGGSAPSQGRGHPSGCAPSPMHMGPLPSTFADARAPGLAQGHPSGGACFDPARGSPFSGGSSRSVLLASPGIAGPRTGLPLPDPTCNTFGAASMPFAFAHQQDCQGCSSGHPSILPLPPVYSAPGAGAPRTSTNERLTGENCVRSGGSSMASASSRLPTAQNIYSIPPDAHSNTFSGPPSQPSMFPYHVAGDCSASPQDFSLPVKHVGSSVASSSASKVRVRTPAQILAGRGKGVVGGAAGDAARIAKAHEDAHEAGFPVGPIVRQDRHSLKRLMISVASDHNKGGGAWGINFGTTEEPTSSGTYVLANFKHQHNLETLNHNTLSC